MRDFAKEFYKSMRWRKAREAYLKEHRYIWDEAFSIYYEKGLNKQK